MSDDPLEEQGEDEQQSPTVRAQETLQGGVQSIKTRLQNTNEAIPWGRVKRAVFAFMLMLLPIPILYLSYQLTGLLDTVIYTICFVLAFGIIPGIIGLLGKETPMNVGMGKFHFVLAQFAAGEGYLVQTGSSYEMCPGDGDRYWLDGEWHNIDDGEQNKTVLGWRPFGIIYHKTQDSLADERVDKTAVGDGGAHDVQRADIQEAAPPTLTTNTKMECLDCGAIYENEDTVQCECGSVQLQISEESKTDGWYVDLKRLYRSGLQRLGNIELVATAEEQTMRDEVDMGFSSKNMTLISSIVGVILGVIVGFIYAYGFGFV